MENVIDLHKADLKAGTKRLHSLPAQSNEWWEVKNRITKYEIAFSQAANMANETSLADKDDLVSQSLKELFLADHLYFYQHLTSPYRPEKKLPEGIANIDDEVVTGDDSADIMQDLREYHSKND